MGMNPLSEDFLSMPMGIGHGDVGWSLCLRVLAMVPMFCGHVTCHCFPHRQETSGHLFLMRGKTSAAGQACCFTH